MTGKIFINYRRADDSGYAQALYMQLEAEFSENNLFMDVEGHIKPGDDFVQVLNAQVSASDILLVVIGPRWSELLAARQGDADDFVTVEITAGLEQGKRVIPVLVGGANMPAQNSLPDIMKPLARLGALGLRPDRFKADCKSLISCLKEQLTNAERERTERNEAGKLKNEPPVNNGTLHQFDALRRAKEPEQSAETFAERVAQAFPDVQGSTAWFNDAKVIASRLSILFQPPLLLQDGHIWWWRGMACMYIESFKHIEGSHYLMWPYELNIRRIAVVRPRSYKRTFLYFEMDADEPTKLYPIEHQRDTNWWLENGYLSEEYGLVDGELLVTRGEYDDGAAMIGGSPVDIRGRCELRVRYTTPYNFLLAPNQSPINSPKEEKRLERYLNQLLLGEDVFEEMCQTIMQLPTKRC